MVTSPRFQGRYRGRCRWYSDFRSESEDNDAVNTDNIKILGISKRDNTVTSRPETEPSHLLSLWSLDLRHED
jgi:hypothetical protein